MNMTPAQLATLKAAILADGTMSAKPMTSGGALEIAGILNAAAAPAYYVWRSSTSAPDILDAITWASLTPADAPDGTILYQNRVLVCQAKQMNIQILLQGRDSLATGLASVRGGLSDALQNVPSGTGGAMLDAGWAGANKVKASITRQASVVEKLFATGNGTTATPSAMGYEGPVSSDDVQAARES